MKTPKELLEKFTTTQLNDMLCEFFSDMIYFDFYREVMSRDLISNTDKFFREFAIAHIREEVTLEELLESGWCSENDISTL